MNDNSNNEDKCTKCNNEMIYREDWIEINGEYRHVQYLYCANCNAVYSMDGELIFAGGRLILT